uniref:Uncharacterized protein n=1 Tax=Zooxanthella nutricula TaxID=1333877 RepID=A0A6U6NGP5_9DINO
MPKGQKAKKAGKAKSVKKTQLKVKKRAQQTCQDSKMDSAEDEVKEQKETAHELFRRHAAERKKVQAEVVELKRQRMKLPKKGQKEAKKALTHKIAALEEAQRERHAAERAAAGVAKVDPSGAPAADASSGDESI